MRWRGDQRLAFLPDIASALDGAENARIGARPSHSALLVAELGCFVYRAGGFV